MKRLVKIGLASFLGLGLFYCGIVVGFNMGHGDKATPVAQASKTETPPTRAELLKLVNTERKKVGVAPLKENPLLDWSSQQKAFDMAEYNYFGHESPKSPNDEGNSDIWLKASGVRCQSISENLVAASNSTLAINWWLHSKQHREAMLNSKFQLTGFGISYAKHIPEANEGPLVKDKADINNTYLVVEHFCQP